ncbi:hypothetical protein [Mycobacterium sp. IS-2888]|uniref:hypothetical protein n=1 Tax=Mycobacterium sp. IS-2888 TaxID=1834159 RepID=UPI00158D21B3|nr:hypothetical protein [Mycobacterium sp. IS-2888]
MAKRRPRDAGEKFASDRWKNQVCAPLEEGINNVKAIDPAQGTDGDRDFAAADS